MSYYHVRISSKSDPSQTEVELDLSLEELAERFVNPYSRGQPIVIAGRAISSDDIERITVTESEGDSTYLNKALLKQRQHFLAAPDHRGRLPSRILAARGEDVTARLITGPPGHTTIVASRPTMAPRPPADSREVFVVHGRNESARDALFNFLRSIGLDPLEWSVAVQATGKSAPYIGEVLDAAFSRTHAVVVLFTPDDEARLMPPFRSHDDPPYESELTGQARPNVLFEAGMAMASAEERTIFVELGNLRPFSDIAGRHTIRLDNSSQRRQELAKRLQAAGCPVNLEGTDWHSAGDFEAVVSARIQGSSESPFTLDRQQTNASAAQLSKDARRLLVEAAKSRSAAIGKVKAFGGLKITTNSKHFVERGDRRSEARWEQAIRELFSRGLVQDPTGADSVFEVTHKGFEAADDLDTSQ